MANIIISKKSIIEAASIVSDELREKADLATQTYNEHYKMVRTLKQTKQICKLRPLNLLTSSTTS